jgi:RHS repeat-associated protein
MELSYDWGFATNQLNGNISGNKWRSKGDGEQRAYGFGYDDVNRFLFADFNQYSGGGWDKSAGVDFTAIMGNGTDPTTAYDLNGNILAMQQNAWQLGGSHTIDGLSYTYNTNSNKLKNVIDADNNPQTTLGDFRTSSLSPYATGKTAAAIDYTYDANGNLLTDLNKDIGTQTTNGIIYNHLNLPWQVSVRSATGTKGTIGYIYDATGNKLKKTTIDNAGNLQTVTTYIGPFQYQGTQSLSSGITPGDTLKFFGQEEGRVRVEANTTGGQSVTSFEYDYFLKDHLGNTRMVLTDETQTDMYPAATMEIGDSATENLYYMNLDDTRSILPPGYPTDTTTNPNAYVAKVSSDGTVPAIGPAVVLKVMAGDQFSIRVSSWYRLNGTTPGTPVSPLTDLLTSLISGISGIPNPEGPGLSVLQANTPTLSSNVLQFLQDTGTSIINTKPHAFVNWILLDNQFNYVATSSGFSQVGNDQQLQKTVLTNLPITSSGYLYIYTSNETPNVDVYFDNLQVTHTRGPLLEEDHYYPFGLTIAGISDKAMKTNYAENKYRYNDKELQNKEFADGTGLEEYDYGARFFDAQIGRWNIQDIQADKYYSQSPYNFVLNNPFKFIDPDGNEVTPSKAFLHTTYGRIFQDLRKNNSAFKGAISKYENNKKFNLTLDVNNAKVKAAGGGAVTESPVDKTNISTSADVNSYYLSSTTVPGNSDYSFTELAAVVIVAHEAIHQNIALTSKDDDDAHNTYNTERNVLVNILSEYNKDNKLGLSSETITALSFSGQQNSKDFKNYINGLAKANGTTYKQEKAKYDALISGLIYKKKDNKK